MEAITNLKERIEELEGIGHCYCNDGLIEAAEIAKNLIKIVEAQRKCFEEIRDLHKSFNGNIVYELPIALELMAENMIKKTDKMLMEEND